MPASPTDQLEEFVNQSAEALTSAMLIDFPAESPEQMEKARLLVKKALKGHLTDVVFQFMLYDIVPILFQLKETSEEEIDAG